MIPKFIRNRGARKEAKRDKSREWNPATFYIIIFTLIGSQAIRMITLKNSYSAYTRTTDAKIELLREVITRVKNGEKVDVEKLLGTGDEAKEREWDEGLSSRAVNVCIGGTGTLKLTGIGCIVLRDIEAEDSLWHQKKVSQSPPEEPKQVEKQEKQEKQNQPPPSGEEGNGDAKAETKRKMKFF